MRMQDASIQSLHEVRANRSGLKLLENYTLFIRTLFVDC